MELETIICNIWFSSNNHDDHIINGHELNFSFKLSLFAVDWTKYPFTQYKYFFVCYYNNIDTWYINQWVELSYLIDLSKNLPYYHKVKAPKFHAPVQHTPILVYKTLKIKHKHWVFKIHMNMSIRMQKYSASICFGLKWRSYKITKSNTIDILFGYTFARPIDLVNKAYYPTT